MARKNEHIKQIDKIIGDKIYHLRLGKGLSREELAKVIGVTHQQLQKYERGVNRLSVGRMVLIAKALKKPIAYFYEGINEETEEQTPTQHQRMCMEVSRNFMKIRSAEYQAALNTLIRSLAKGNAA